MGYFLGFVTISCALVLAERVDTQQRVTLRWELVKNLQHLQQSTTEKITMNHVSSCSHAVSSFKRSLFYILKSMGELHFRHMELFFFATP